MGFFGGISKILGGGSDSSSRSNQSSFSGLAALPQYAQDAFKSVIQQGQGLLQGQGGTNMFTPLPQTQAETQAYNLAQLPTSQQGVQSLTSQYFNPWMQYAYDDINRESEGQNSLLKQALNNSGQMGSNREYLGAGQIDEARLRAIGNTSANAYGQAQQTGLQQNQQNIQNLLAQGSDQRNIASSTQQAPLQALQQLAALLGVLPNSSNSTGSSSAKSSSSNGFLSSLASFGGG